MEGFCGFIGAAHAITAELWGIRQVLKLVKERRWEDVEIESDSVIVVELVNGTKNVDNHSERMLIEAGRTLKAEINAEIFRIYRKANKCTDKLAKV